MTARAAKRAGSRPKRSSLLCMEAGAFSAKLIRRMVMAARVFGLSEKASLTWPCAPDPAGSHRHRRRGQHCGRGPLCDAAAARAQGSGHGEHRGGGQRPGFAGGPARGRGRCGDDRSGHAYAGRATGADGKNVDIPKHIGFDTVNLQGEHFTAHVSKGDAVTRGHHRCRLRGDHARGGVQHEEGRRDCPGTVFCRETSRRGRTCSRWSPRRRSPRQRFDSRVERVV